MDNPTLIMIYAVLGGYGISVIIDFIWMKILDHKSIESGYEALEHYHASGFIFLGVALTAIFIPEFPSIIHYVLIGLAFGLFSLEAHQKNAFAYHSTHFKTSTIIGAILGIAVICSMLYLLL